MPALPRLYLNQIPSLDWLIALEFGRVDDGQPHECWDGVSDQLGFLRDGPDGPIVGFKVVGASAYDPDADEHAPLWEGPRFAVPVLGLDSAAPNEIVVAARALFGDAPTVNRELFDAAIDVTGEDALRLWLRCLQAGDSMAHFALGYTLYELGRLQEAYRHLRHYTEISPAGPWNWCWYARAAAALGHLDEAREACAHALELEDPSNPTDASDLLVAIESGGLPVDAPAAPDGDELFATRMGALGLPGGWDIRDGERVSTFVVGSSRVFVVQDVAGGGAWLEVQIARDVEGDVETLAERLGADDPIVVLEEGAHAVLSLSLDADELRDPPRLRMLVYGAAFRAAELRADMAELGIGHRPPDPAPRIGDDDD